MRAFQADVTLENCFSEVDFSVHIATLIFVLSAIHPDKFRKYVELMKCERGRGKVSNIFIRFAVINCFLLIYLSELLKIYIMFLVVEEYCYFETMDCMTWLNYVLNLDTKSVRIFICDKMELGNYIIFINALYLNK